MSRHRLLISVFLLVSASSSVSDAQTTSETDRLRDALRSAIAQTRTLEDQQAVMQAKQAESQREVERLKGDVDAAQTATKEAEKAQAAAVDDYNHRLEERNQILEKWKAAYEDAANVARTKDAERSKFEAESKAFKASTKSCAQRNIKLVAIGNELLERIDQIQTGDVILGHDPLVGFKRVEVQNTLRDYQDKILEQRANP